MSQSLNSPWAYMALDWGDRPWESILDAGTGDQSLEWLISSECRRWTAVSACPKRVRKLRRSLIERIRTQDRILCGTWSDPHFLKGEVHDVVVAHYLLGAVERFTPYYEHLLFSRLRPHVGEKLYVVGLEPTPPPSSEEEQIVHELLSFRDAVFLLRGERHYREFPLVWVEQNLKQSGYRIVENRCFPNLFGERFVRRVVESTLRQSEGIEDRELAKNLKEKGLRLQARALALCEERTWLHSGFDYLIIAEPK